MRVSPFVLVAALCGTVFATSAVAAPDCADEAAALVNEVLETVTADMLDQMRSYLDKQVTVRWILMRLLTHTAQHLGQMQILRKLWALHE